MPEPADPYPRTLAPDAGVEYPEVEGTEALARDIVRDELIRERDAARAEAARWQEATMRASDEVKRLHAIRNRFGEPADLAAEAARWQAEAERLREALVEASRMLAAGATTLSKLDDQGSASILLRAANAALSAGGETDA